MWYWSSNALAHSKSKEINNARTMYSIPAIGYPHQDKSETKNYMRQIYHLIRLHPNLLFEEDLVFSKILKVKYWCKNIMQKNHYFGKGHWVFKTNYRVICSVNQKYWTVVKIFTLAEETSCLQWEGNYPQYLCFLILTS